MNIADFAISAEQCLAGRALARLSQSDLATAASVAISTVADFEAGRRTPRQASMAAIVSALEKAGVQFIPENGGGAGVRLRKRKR